MQTNIKSAFSRIGFGLLLFMLIPQLLLLFLTPELARSLHNMLGDWYFWVLSYAPMYFLGFPVLFLILCTIPDGRPVEDHSVSLDFSPFGFVKWSLICLGITYVLNIASNVLASLLSVIKDSGEVENPLETMVSTGSPLINLFFIVVIAPVMEEWIFRKLLYNKLRRYGGKVYIFTSALTFALFHMNLFQSFYALALGAIFAAITYYTGKVRYSILLHVAVNFFGSGLGMLLMEYTNEGVVAVYGIVILILMVVGLSLAVNWWRKNKHKIQFQPAEIELPNMNAVLLNPGMLVFTFIMCAMTVINFFA